MKITDRIDRITGLTPEYSKPFLPAPKSVKIELTARCDLSCFFCATGQKLRPKGDMEWSLMTRLLRQMREAGVEEIGLFYLGESMLYRRLAQAVHFAKHECGYPYTFLTTNGRLATQDKVYQLAKAGLNSLKFSLNAADREQFKEITGVDAFNRVITNIKSARAAIDLVRSETGHRCGLYTSSILYDGEQQARMEAVTREIEPYVDQHYYLPLYGQAGLTAGAKGTKPVAGNIGRIGALRDPLPCWSIFTEGHVTFDGYLSACCFDHDGRFHMGDLKQTAFMEAWNSKPFQELRRAHLGRDVARTVCEGCIVYQ